MLAARPIRTRALAALAALALGAALTSCGSDESSASADPTTGLTSESSAEPSEATDEPSPIDDGGQVAVGDFAERIQAGLDKLTQAHSEITMSGTGGEFTGSGDIDYTTTPPEMAMTMKVGTESFEMLLVDGTVYIKSGQTGPKYIAFDLSDPTNPLGAGFADQLDPAAAMESFTTAVTSVTSAGTEEIDGQSLERFELVMDTTKLPQSSTAGQQLPPEIEATVWLDSEDRMVRSRINLGALTTDTALSDFGKEVSIEAPPADQVAQTPAG